MGNRNYGSAAILLTYAIALAASAYFLLESPRFWAEEATLYYQNALNIGFRSIFSIINGNYQFLANAAAYLATLVPPLYAPAVTTYISLAVDAIAVLGIVLMHRQGVVTLFGALGLSILWVLSMPKYEVQLTATNIQWVCAAGLVFFLAIRGDALGRARFAFLAWVALCGLTGVPSCLLFPAFLIKGYFEKDRTHTVAGIILLACVVVQAVVITHAGTTGRVYTRDPFLLVMPTAVQTILTPTFGADASNLLGAFLQQPQNRFSTASLSIFLLFIGALGGAVLAAARRDTLFFAITAGCLWIGTGVVQTFGATGDPVALLGGIAGSRYYLTGLMCFLTLLAVGGARSQIAPKVFCSLLLVMFAANAVSQRAWAPWTVIFLTGPSWSEQVHKCPANEPCRLTAWPGGDWVVETRNF